MDGSTSSSAGDVMDGAWFRSCGATGALSSTVTSPESNIGTCTRPGSASTSPGTV